MRTMHSLTHLLHHKDGVVNLLALQDGVEVVHEDRQVLLSVSIRDYNSNLMAGSAVRRLVVSPRFEFGVKRFLRLESRWEKVELDDAH